MRKTEDVSYKIQNNKIDQPFSLVEISNLSNGLYKKVLEDSLSKDVIIR